MRFMTAVAANLVGTGVAIAGLFLISMIVIGGIIASSTPAVQPIRNGSVLLLDLSGTLPEVVSGDPLAQAFGQESAYGLFDLTQSIERAATDNRIKALWIRTGGLGTSWATLQSLRRAIETFKTSGKHVVASSPSFSINEGSYFVASLADSVYADPHAMIEFNGMALTVSFYADLLDRLDVRVEAIRAGTFKSAVEPYFRKDLSDENREQLQRLADNIADVFITAVSEDRGLSEEKINHLMETRALMTAQDAIEAGLVDGIKYDHEIQKSLLQATEQESDEQLRVTPIKSYVRESRSQSANSKANDIAVVYVVGAMMPGRSSDVPNPLLGGNTVGSETFIRALRRARRNERTKAIVIRIDSPGGAVPAADAMLEEIRSAALDVPVVVSMGGVAASGGYWIAAGAETIVAESLSLTGSIGVFSLLFNTSEFMSGKLGITFDGVKTHPYADMMSGANQFSDAERAMLQRTTDHVYQSFLELVAESRDLTIEQVDAVAQGRVWTGADALEAGLIDDLGGLDLAIDYAATAAGLVSDDHRVRVYSTPRGFLDRLTQPGIRIAASLLLSATGMGPYQSIAGTANHLNDMIRYNGMPVARMPFDIQSN